jgi:FAD/FMN-containing dehydrogenase
MGLVTVALRRLRRTLATWAFNTASVGIYLVTLGKQAIREGHYRGRRGWTNWSRVFEARPERFETPTTLEELCEIVRGAVALRTVGAGHSFNGSPLSPGGVMLSLDGLDQIVAIDAARKVVTVQAGMRLYRLTARLAEAGLALPLLGSHNRQSIGGLIATDLHGTGRHHGFLSEAVLALQIMDAAGEVREVRRGDELFHAAIGAIGTCGIVTQVELQCVSQFNLAKSVEVRPRAWVRDNIDRLVADNDHLSFYYIGGVDVRNVRMNLWNRSSLPIDRGLGCKKVWYELLDMAVSGYLLGISRALSLARPFAALGLLFFKLTMHGRRTVYPSPSGFSRTLYYHHDEIEYGVAYERHRECLDEVLELMQRRRFVAIVEVRFTPAASQALVGPGAGRRTCFIEVAPSLSLDSRAFYSELEDIFARYDGRPHLGKQTAATREIMQERFGARWTRFRAVQVRQDPEGKFVNAFAQPIFGLDPVREQAATPSARPAQRPSSGSHMSITRSRARSS